jgi:hypothetical protein
MFGFMKVGDRVVASTSSIRLPDDILHEAEIIAISEYRNFFKVRYLECPAFEEWLNSFNVERFKKRILR